jgi:membrane dipeptidase
LAATLPNDKTPHCWQLQPNTCSRADIILPAEWYIEAAIRQWPDLEGFCNRASLMTSPRRVPIFDGHNDVLLRLYRRGGTDAPRAFLEGEGKGQLDLPMARQGGFAGGLFAIFVPSANGAVGPNGEAPSQNVSSGAPLAPTVELMPAQRAVFAMVSLLLRIERESQGRVRVCRNVDDIQQGIEDGVLAPVLHIEGAEAIDPSFELLDVL